MLLISTRLLLRQIGDYQQLTPDILKFVMKANSVTEATDILDAAIAGFRSSFRQVGPLPSRIALYRRNLPGPQPSSMARLTSRDQGIQVTLAVEVKRTLQPRDVEQILPGISRVLRTLAGNVPLLVVTPGSAQELVICWPLRALTMWISPAMPEYHSNIRPSSSRRWGQTVTVAARTPAARVRGPKADDSCVFSWMSPSVRREGDFWSHEAQSWLPLRLLDTSTVRPSSSDPTGRVTSVISLPHAKMGAVVRRLQDNSTTTFLSPAGAAAALKQLRTRRRTPCRSEGSFAAVRRAPVAAPAMLVIYCDDVATTADSLKLLPATPGKRCAAEPFDKVVWKERRSRRRDVCGSIAGGD